MWVPIDWQLLILFSMVWPTTKQKICLGLSGLFSGSDSDLQGPPLATHCSTVQKYLKISVTTNFFPFSLFVATGIWCTFTGPHAFGPKIYIYFVPKILMKQPHDCSY